MTVGVGIAIFVVFCLGAIAYIAIESGFIDVVRYRFRRRREDWREDG
jgi:hypothetical protein